MNIKEAKEQIKNAMTGVFYQGRAGRITSIPIERQRPVFLHGTRRASARPPLWSRSPRSWAWRLAVLLHDAPHAAVGARPALYDRAKGLRRQGVCIVTEYTMSEIIASVYDMHRTEPAARRGHFVSRRDKLRLRDAGARVCCNSCNIRFSAATACRTAG